MSAWHRRGHLLLRVVRPQARLASWRLCRWLHCEPTHCGSFSTSTATWTLRRGLRGYLQRWNVSEAVRMGGKVFKPEFWTNAFFEKPGELSVTSAHISPDSWFWPWIGERLRWQSARCFQTAEKHPYVSTCAYMRTHGPHVQMTVISGAKTTRGLEWLFHEMWFCITVAEIQANA